jgi:hypothetical protein
LGERRDISHLKEDILTDKKKVEDMDATEIQSMVVRVEDSVKAIAEIKDDEQMNVVQNSRNYIKRILKRIDDLYDEIIKKNREALETSRSKKKEVALPYVDADRHFGTILSHYLTKKIKAKEEEQKAILAEQLKKKRQLEKKIEKAAELEEEGKKDQAEAVFQEVEEIAEDIKEKAPLPQAPAMKHGHFREVWEAEYINEKIIPRKYWTLNKTLVERTVRAQKEKTSIPGVRAKKRIIPVSSRT